LLDSLVVVKYSAVDRDQLTKGGDPVAAKKKAAKKTKKK
jgi:hypothetical protein